MLSIKSKDPVSFFKRFSCIFPNYITAEARQGRDGKGNRPAVVVFKDGVVVVVVVFAVVVFAVVDVFVWIWVLVLY